LGHFKGVDWRMKARAIFELIPPIKDLIYGKNPHVLVKKSYGKYERHYFKINENNELLVHGKHPDEEGSLYNPTIKGKPTYDADGRFFLKWDEKDKFAYPIDGADGFQDSVNIDLKIKTAYSIGFLNGRNNNPTGAKKGFFDDKTNLILILLIIASIALLFLTYTGFTDLGVVFFGGQ